MKLRLATNIDLPRMWEIILQAKAQMYRESKQQWDETYPLPEHLQADINKGYAHVLEEDGKVIAYGAIVFDGEPAYDHIEGEWLSIQPYVVLYIAESFITPKVTDGAMNGFLSNTVSGIYFSFL